MTVTFRDMVSLSFSTTPGVRLLVVWCVLDSCGPRVFDSVNLAHQNGVLSGVLALHFNYFHRRVSAALRSRDVGVGPMP